MDILSAEKRRGKQYLLTVLNDSGDEIKTLIDSRTYDESGYKHQNCITEDEYEGLLTVSRQNRAREKALYLLSLRDHSKSELMKKLRDGENTDEAAAAVDRMEELGLIDDAVYASRLAKDLRERKHYSRRHAIQELQSRGIGRETAENAVDKIPVTDFVEALALIQKKRYNLNDEETGCKAAGMLARLGFGWSDIRAAIKEVKNAEIENEDDE